MIILYMHSEIVNYAYRDDFISYETLLRHLNEGHIMLLGLPGVGKSTWVKEIAAKCTLRKRVAIILSVDHAANEPRGYFELIKVDNNLIAIPSVKIPVFSIEGEDVLNAIINSLSSLQKYAEKVSDYIERANRVHNDAEQVSRIMNDLRESIEFKNILNMIPEIIPASRWEEIRYIATAISDAAPYLGLFLRGAEIFLKWRREKKLDELEEQQAIIIVDDLADLSPNWQILSPLLKYKFHYLFVLRVHQPNEYISMLRDRSYANDYLQENGIRVTVRRHLILPPPSFTIFGNIMKNNGISQDKIDALWNVSGGIPAIALMAWKERHGEKLDEMFEEAKKKLRDNSIELTWDVQDLEIRFTLANNFVKMIYDDLKNKNYAYAALTASYPWPLAAEEMALFCGYRFSKICTCDDNNVKDVYDFMRKQANYDEERKIEVVDSPPIGSQCHHQLDESMVEKFEESWSISTFESGQIKNTLLPTIGGQDGIRPTNRFNNLFQHFPVMLNEMEKYEYLIHNELTSNRKVLLQVIEREWKVLGVAVPPRMVYLAYFLIQEIEDLGASLHEAARLISVILKASPPLGLRLFDILQDKFGSWTSISQIDYASLILSISMLARRTLYKKVIDKSLEMIESSSVTDSDDRRVLLLAGISLAHLGVSNCDEGNRETGLLLARKANEILKKISEVDDSLSVYAKIAIPLQLAGIKEYFALENLEKVEDQLSKLNKYSMDDLKWMNGPGFDIMLDILAHKAQMNDIYGDYLIAADRPSEAVRRYEKSKEVNERISRYSNVLQDRRLIALAKLMEANNDNELRLALEELCNLDNDLLLSEQGLVSDMLSDYDASSAHANAVFARVALREVFHEERKEDFNDSLIQDLFFLAKLQAGIALLQKILHGTADTRNFLAHALAFMAPKDSERQIPLLAIGIYNAIETGHDYLLTKQDERDEEFERVPIEQVKRSIEEGYDMLPYSNIQLCCRPYRDIPQDGVFAEVVCTEAYLWADDSLIFAITCHLLYENYECAVLLIKTIEFARQVSPLHKRLLRELRQALENYINAGAIERISMKFEIIKSYLRYWYSLRMNA
jgi:hypothetical protein